VNLFDRLMLEFYRVLNNAWRESVRNAAYIAIQMLAELPPQERLNEMRVRKWMEVIEKHLGQDFAAAVNEPVKEYMRKSYHLGLQDVQRMGVKAGLKISIGLYGYENEQIIAVVSENNVFWIKGVGEEAAQPVQELLTKAFKEGWTKQDLATALKEEFSDIANNSDHYWLGLAEHMLLRIREFGRLNGYKSAGATYYRLTNPMDDRTSEICWALVGANKIYKLSNALEVMEKVNDIDVGKIGLEEARARLKAIAPWINEKQIVRDEYGQPIDVEGNHTPFPPFHWRCRTQTEMVFPDELK